MLINEDRFGTYGIRFHENEEANTANIWSIGLERQTSISYDWNGRNRMEDGVYVFQFTLSGRGMIDVDGERYSLKPGHGFFVNIPGNHRYFLPEESAEWTFIYITLSGEEVARCWNFIQQELGNVVMVANEKQVIQRLFHIYEQVQYGEIVDKYTASAKAYDFIMECYRFVKEMDAPREQTPKAILEALSYMKAHFNTSIGLGDIAAASGLSKYYFIHKFRESMGITPLQYLTKLRIEKAVELLRFTQLQVKEIAVKSGYADPNYFNKVFRKYVGISANQIRKGDQTPPIDHLLIK